MREATGQLAALDRDGNGVVELKEVPRTYRLVVAAGRSAGSYLRVSSRTRIRPRSRSPSLPAWFTRMDRNGDGDVSPREFLGTAAQFQQLDVDQDGLVSPAEAQR